jgi:hypothetical protein
MNMATKKQSKSVKPKKRSDVDRHARFVETARKIGASEDPADFEKAFSKFNPRAATGPASGSRK